jgi:hypothetical protein
MLDFRKTYDRAAVMAQLADASGAPAGPWIKLHPYQNGYDEQNAEDILNCAFDPIDDGNTEDDFKYPSDPRYGPSATCYPDPAFAYIGETSSPFAAGSVGLADGPGLEGAWGIGTWIESRFDLGRFRGRSVRLRFLAASIKAPEPAETWEDAFGINPHPCDDGWWIDDVAVTGALASAAAVAVDVKDNSALPGPPAGDADGDGQSDVCDNCPVLGNGSQQDQDHDELGDACDACPTDPTNFDPDGDWVCAAADNCPFDANPAQADGDDDGSGLPCDCADADPSIHPGAIEWNDGKDNQCPGDSGYGSVDEISGQAVFSNKTLFVWQGQPGASLYQAARARSADFAVGCQAFPSTNLLFVSDGTKPVPGGVFFYLVRAKTPNAGSWGQTSAGQERVVPCAP